VGDGAIGYWYGNEVLFGNFSGLRNSSSHVSTFGEANADTVFAVTYNHECAETEATATLYDASYAVDVYDAFVKLFFFWWDFRAATATVRAAGATALCLLFCHD
jgi:hypothetical protein